jgi:hypothetical protein
VSSESLDELLDDDDDLLCFESLDDESDEDDDLLSFDLLDDDDDDFLPSVSK